MVGSSEKVVSIVCPMANEGASAVDFTEAVIQQCHSLRFLNFFAIFDNATKDDSYRLMCDYAKVESRLKVIWAPESQCVVDAYIRGYHEALAINSDWILEIDAGFSHQPEDICRFLEFLSSDYDCVFGSRFMPGGRMIDKSIKRYLVSRGGTLLANLLLNTKQTDMTSGFELFSRRALSKVLARGVQSRAHFFQTEIKFHCRHMKYVEVPITYKSPSPRLGSAPLKEAFVQLWRLRKERNVLSS